MKMVFMLAILCFVVYIFYDIECGGEIEIRPRTMQYGEEIIEASRTYGVSPKQITAIIKIESAFKPWAVSRSGAIGLMQIMPETGQKACKLTKKQLFNPRLNIMCGTKFFAWLLKFTKYDQVRAAACYNAGPGNCTRYAKKGYYIPPFRETVKYVEKYRREIRAG